MSEWISVNDVIPAKNRHVLLFGEKNGDTIIITGFLGGKNRAPELSLTVDAHTYSVPTSHWMPLPKPPND